MYGKVVAVSWEAVKAAAAMHLRFLVCFREQRGWQRVEPDGCEVSRQCSQAFAARPGELAARVGITASTRPSQPLACEHLVAISRSTNSALFHFICHVSATCRCNQSWQFPQQISAPTREQRGCDHRTLRMQLRSRSEGVIATYREFPVIATTQTRLI